MPAEYGVDHFTEALTRGLRPESNSPINSPFLVQCLNARPTPAGVEAPSTITQPFTNAVAWPHPVMHRMIGATRLFDDTAISDLNTTTWAKTALTTYDATAPATPLAIASGSQWQIADFGEFWMASNGVSAVAKAPWILANDLITSNAVIQPKCVTRFGNSLVLGDIEVDAIPGGSRWSSFLAEVFKYAPENETTTVNDTTLSSNHILYQRVSGDAYAPFSMLLAMIHFEGLAGYSGGIDDINEYILTEIRRRNIGVARVSHSGDILAMEELGSNLVVYTTAGTSILNQDMVEVETLDLRIGGRGCVVNLGDAHLIVDDSSVLWAFSSAEGLQKLDFQEFVSNLTLSNITMSHDSEENETYISDGSTTYVIGKGFFYETYKMPTRVVRFGDNLYSALDSDGATSTMVLKTDEFDFNYFDLKRLEKVEIIHRNVVQLLVGIDYRYGSSDSFSTLAGVSGSPEGVHFPPGSGIGFRLNVTGDLSSNGVIQRIVARMKYASGRTTRGPRRV